MGRRSYLARLAEPFGEAGPVLFPVPQAAPEEARPAWRAAGAAGGAVDAQPPVARGRKATAVPAGREMAARGGNVAPGAVPAASAPRAAAAAGPVSASASPASLGPAGALSVSGAPAATLQRKPAATRDNAPGPRPNMAGEASAASIGTARAPVEMGVASAVSPPAVVEQVESRSRAPAARAETGPILAWGEAVAPPAMPGAARPLPPKPRPIDDAPVARAEPVTPARGVAAPDLAQPSGPRIHIGTVEVRTVSAPAPQPAPPPAPRSALAAANGAARLASGYGWHFGLGQG